MKVVDGTGHSGHYYWAKNSRIARTAQRPPLPAPRRRAARRV